MKALSVRQPYAWAIIHGAKNVENRRWRTSYRGPLLIHAGVRLHDVPPPVPLDASAFLAQRGGYVGIVDLVDIVRDSTSRWAASGYWHWILSNPRPLPFMPARGQQSLYVPPEYVLAHARLLYEPAA